MSASPNSDAELSRPARLTGTNIIDAMKRGGVEFVVALPDIVTCDGMLWPIRSDTDFRLVMVCKEDEGVSICTGLSYSDKRAVLLMQHTGFLDSVNAIRAVAVEYGHPVVMIVGLQGHAAGTRPTESTQYGVRILEPILDAMGVAYAVLDTDSDVAAVVPAIEDAYANSRPFVFLVSRSPD